jgi:Ni,Fe-hydrogenase III small subunit
VANDLDRFGLTFLAFPGHADELLVTGPAARNMAEAIRRALGCTPAPRSVVASGDSATDGKVLKGSQAVARAVGAVLAVNLLVPGYPPCPPRCSTDCLRFCKAEAGPEKRAGRIVSVFV